MIIKRLSIFIFIIICSTQIINAQEIEQNTFGSNTENLAVPEEETMLPRAYRTIELGMEQEAVKEILKSDSLFTFRGDPDVSLVPHPKESIIEVSGPSYIRRAYFQFYEGKLFIMIFTINERLMDHYSMFTTLSLKYGKPDSLSPKESIWTDNATRISLERPLNLKYIDIAVFEKLKQEASIDKSEEEISRNEFLNNL